MPTQAVQRHRVRDLVPSDDLPPSSQVMKFVTFYVAHRDLKLAACQAYLLPEMGAKLYRDKKVRALIDRKTLLLDVEEAKLKAKANLLTVDRLDATLIDLLGKKENGHVRLRATELGYKRTGLIKDGEFYVAPDPTAGNNQPSIYQTTLRRTVTEEVTQTHPPALPAAAIFAVKEY